MLELRLYAVFCLILISTPSLVFADNASQIQALKDEKALIDARQQRDFAAATAANTAVDLAKANASLLDVSSTVQKAQLDNATALTKSQTAAQSSQIDALKSTYGAPPSVGNDGNLTISDGSTSALLEIKKGSLSVTKNLAKALCDSLTEESIGEVFLSPPELDSKIQNSRMVLREFNALSEKVKNVENRKLAGLDGAKEQVAPAVILGAVSLLQYGAGAIQAVSKLFQSDYAVGLSSSSSRADWFEYFMAKTCSSHIPYPQVEQVVRKQSIDNAISQLNEMLEFSNAAGTKKASLQKQIDLTNARIVAIKADKTIKTDTKELEAQIDRNNESIKQMLPLDAWVPRIQALITLVSTTPSTFLDALTWYSFGDDNNELGLSKKNRLIVTFTTQDAQIIKSNWLTGKKVYGRSSGELIYRVMSPDGKVLSAGYLTAHSSVGEIEFKNKESSTVENSSIK